MNSKGTEIMGMTNQEFAKAINHGCRNRTVWPLVVVYEHSEGMLRINCSPESAGTLIHACTARSLIVYSLLSSSIRQSESV